MISIFNVVVTVTTKLNFRAQLLLGLSLSWFSLGVFGVWCNALNVLMCLVGHIQGKEGPDVDEIEE